MQIRKCDINDLEALKAISINTFIDTYAHLNTPENVEKHLAHAFNDHQLTDEINHPYIVFYLFYQNGHLCGYLKLCWNDAQSEKMDIEYIEIERIYVLKAFHRQGIGRKMVEYTRDVAIALNKSKIWLGVWKKNPEAVIFYKKVGFKIFGEHTFTVGDDEQSDWMMEMHV